ncbi:MAG TPA: hypothetical protein VL625_12655, partial [Patescibacteria group bacterium]|nr:hypothetical protein [Patescibacteria group bacterium]
FFMFSNNMGIVHETAYYTGHEHASRFASFWFVPWLVTQQDMIARGLPTPMTQTEIDSERKKFSHMVGEDIARYKPAVILIGHFDMLAGRPFDFMTYFGVDPYFERAWAGYKKDGMLKVRLTDYFPDTAARIDTINYDIYRLAAAGESGTH